MTIADFDFWVSDMQELIELPRRARLRLTENGLTITPASQAHKATQTELANQIGDKLPGWQWLSQFSVVPPREGYKPEPDVSAVRAEDFDPAASEACEDRLPFVVEIVAKESRERHHETKPAHYALRGIPAYLVVDVRRATWTLYQEPNEAKYQRVTEGEFGEEIVIPVDGEPMLRLDSSKFRRFV
ncbi:MAG TPA: Uma2 family endonuclease [Actinocrinis sp.]|jgi:Uma2 family endonuclease|uniref:Uma2 family endonuclease n=1 Tax=Actinocrinis sp. TaxID=1920516 RepID=UPI002DDD9F92|nr:Uma2 family endonuclease [Actinocrinis sp.]HEV3169203.1 Uma2 family endonuclease [Actinocrinis sp.]